MDEIKIKCPTCGKVLRLKDAPNINAAFFTCPVCHERHLVGKCQRYVEQPEPQALSGEETRYGPALAQQPGEDETRIGAMSQTMVGALSDGMGRTYQLRLGINTIGRKAQTSAASVQVATDDRTMSRSHAIIEVRNAGGQTVHILRNGANKNPSYLNGTLIGQQDLLILNNGDRIKMGNTELTFKI